MKKFKIFIPLVSVFFLLIGGCHQKGDNENALRETGDTMNSDNGFLNVYKKFSDAIIHKSFQEFNSLIDSATGIFIIESPGALPVVYHLMDVEAFVSQNEKTLFDFFNDKILLPPIDSVMPVIDCNYVNETPYDKTGCFMKDISASWESELNFLTIAGGNDSDKIKAEAARKKLNMKVINTYNHVYYFTKHDSNWYLTFIDMRTPCSA